jgi:hypothetical protein
MVPNPSQVSSSVPAEFDLATSDTLNQFLFTGALTWTRVTLNVISTTVSIVFNPQLPRRRLTNLGIRDYCSWRICNFYGVSHVFPLAATCVTNNVSPLLPTPSGHIQGAIQTGIPNRNSTIDNNSDYFDFNSHRGSNQCPFSIRRSNIEISFNRSKSRRSNRNSSLDKRNCSSSRLTYSSLWHPRPPLRKVTL